MSKTLYLIRHGQTRLNASGIVQGQGMDVDLNEVGWRQSKLFWESFQQTDFDLVVFSNLIRSKQTVMPFFRNNIQAVQFNDLREINWGINEGQPSDAAVISRYNDVIAQWMSGNYEASIHRGESAAQLGDRASNFINWISKVNRRQILACSHGRTIRAIVCLLLNKPLSEMEIVRHDNLGLFKFTFNSGKWHMDLDNNTDHLKV